jgi:hypothetical protein
MASMLGFGTGTVNFFGRSLTSASAKKDCTGVVWTEREEPQAALGSPSAQARVSGQLPEALRNEQRRAQGSYHHHGREILDLTLRGEYLYTANGEDGFEVFDVANIDNKGFSERIVSTPVSPIGQRTRIRTKYATSVTLPSTLGIDPLRLANPPISKVEIDPKNQPGKMVEIYTGNEEQPISPIYAWVFITDREEGPGDDDRGNAGRWQSRQ